MSRRKNAYYPWGLFGYTLSYQAMHVGVDLSRNTCYDMISQGMGCYGERVEKIEQLVPALQRAVASGRPALLHVVVDPAVNVDPPGFKEFRQIRTQ